MDSKNATVTRVALYIRVSTEEQALHGYSLNAQEEALRQYATDHQYKVAGIYRDEGISGRKPYTKRPMMLKLLADAEQGLFDLILFTKLDRWFRSVKEYHKVQAVLDNAHIAWQAILEDYSTATADGRLKVNIMLSVAENEADRTSERIKFVLQSKRQKGEITWGGPPPLGYQYIRDADGKRRLVKDPATAPIVEYFFDCFRQNHNTRKSEIEANAAFGLTIADSTWRKIIKRPVYKGEVNGIQGLAEPFITPDEWETFNSRPYMVRQTKQIYLFSGLLRCPVCGKSLKAHSTGEKYRSYHSYKCYYKDLHRCLYPFVFSERKIEKYLVENLTAELDRYASELKASRAKQRKKPNPDTSIEKLSARLKRLNNIYLSGNISDEDYAVQSAAIKKAIQQAEDASRADDKIIDITKIQKAIGSDFTHTYWELEPEARRNFWHEIISQIVLSPTERKIERIIFRT